MISRCTVTDCIRKDFDSVGYCALHSYRIDNNIPLDNPITIEEKKYISKIQMRRCRKTEKYNIRMLKTRDERLKKYKEYNLKNKEKLRIKDKEYYYNNQEKRILNSKLYRENNKEKVLQREYLWRQNNREKLKEKNQKYYKEHYGKVLTGVLKRQKSIRQSNKFNIFLEEIDKIYQLCPDNMVVDHILPLQGENVCGLHVPWNLQYLSFEENNYKRNKFDFSYENNSWKEVFNKYKKIK